ncbi:MAG: SDR family oxidoreductase, partial [Verrucomicrobiota bacterium]
DVEFPEQVTALAEKVGQSHGPIDGIVHSIAFANYSEGFKPFHETVRKDFLQATSISAFSLVEVANAFKPFLSDDASVVSIGISSTDVTAENYGYMAPIKAALETCSYNLAKSFSADSRVRFNTVNAGPLKTSASAGIPGYIESYLYAEKLTFRKQNLTTQEVANTAVFLLSSASSGINGQGIVVNAGMDRNYFDQGVISDAMRPDK